MGNSELNFFENFHSIFISSKIYPKIYLFVGHFFKKEVGFTPCKAEQPLQGVELQEKEAQKD